MTGKLILKLLFIACAAVLINACGGSGSSGDERSSGDEDSTTDAGVPLVRAEVSRSDIIVGDSFEIEIGIDNLPASEGGGVSLQYDPAVIRIDAVQVNPGWDFASRSGRIDNLSGQISDILFASYDGNDGSVDIATINATAIGSGTSQIQISESAGNPFAASGNRIAVQFENNSINVGL